MVDVKLRCQEFPTGKPSCPLCWGAEMAPAGCLPDHREPVSLNGVDYNRKHECCYVKWYVEAWYSCEVCHSLFSSLSHYSRNPSLNLELTNWLSSQLQGSTCHCLPRAGPADLLCYSAYEYCVCVVLANHFVHAPSHTEYP